MAIGEQPGGAFLPFAAPHGTPRGAGARLLSKFSGVMGGGLKSATVNVFTPQKLASGTNQGWLLRAA